MAASKLEGATWMNPANGISLEAILYQVPGKRLGQPILRNLRSTQAWYRGRVWLCGLLFLSSRCQLSDLWAARKPPWLVFSC